MIIGNILLGIGLGALLLWFCERQSAHYFKYSLANGLILGAIVYVIFSLQMFDFKWMMIELSGVFIYSAFAIAALRHRLYWLGIGWLLHVVWDAVLHANGHPGYVPLWYIHACMGFDVVIGAYVLWKYYRLNTSQLSA